MRDILHKGINRMHRGHKNDSYGGARNSKENSPPIHDLDDLNRVEKFYDTGRVKETMYCDHCEGAQHSHRCEYIHASSRRAQVLEMDDSESIMENRNKVDSHRAIVVRKYGVFQHVWMVLGLYSAPPTSFQSTMQKIREEFKESISFYRMAKTVAQIVVRFVFSIKVK